METHLILFLITSLVIIITPGQDLLLVLSRSVSQGIKAGVSTAAGVSTGLIGHTLLAALGLGSILRASETLFTVVKIAGAIYLLYLGFKLIRTRAAVLELTNVSGGSNWTFYLQGTISNLSNPKIAIFYLAFLPQFVPSGVTNPTLQLLYLGLSFSMLTFLIKAPIGFGAGSLAGWIKARPAVRTWINRVSGGILIGLGIRLAFERRG
jgi:threonine/homoserine/homoserine lactone efflux protein